MSKASQIWINGDFVSANEAQLSVFDLGVSVGLGVFETLMAYRGVLPNFEKHLDRLENSAELVELKLPSREKISEVVAEVLRKNHLENSKRARVRITLGAGEHVLTAKEVSRSVEDYLIISAVQQSDSAEHAELAELAVVPMLCNEHAALAGVKSTSYAENILAYRHAAKLGVDEAVMLNTSNHLCECAMANLFLVKDGKVLTPSLASGCLPGVTRQIVIQLCQGNSITCIECDLSENDLRSADEIFITSSAREIQLAKMLGSELSCSGEITQRLSLAYKDYISKKVENGAQ